jgi:hypothetical protein
MSCIEKALTPFCGYPTEPGFICKMQRAAEMALLKERLWGDPVVIYVKTTDPKRFNGECFVVYPPKEGHYA